MSTPVKVSADLISKIMVLLSVLFLFRGHNYPGGGFVGALIGAAALALYTLAYDLRAKQFSRFVPKLLALGISCFLFNLVFSVINATPPLTGFWYNLTLPGQTIKVGTPLVFDIGVYCIILGSLSWLMVELEDKLR
jgi:multicomponent Na+:H+ antiporter subunit B